MSISKYSLPEAFTDEEKEGHWFLHEVTKLQYQNLKYSKGDLCITTGAYEMQYGDVDLFDMPSMMAHLEVIESIDQSCGVVEYELPTSRGFNSTSKLCVKRNHGRSITTIRLLYLEKIFLMKYHEYVIRALFRKLPLEIAKLINSFTVAGFSEKMALRKMTFRPTAPCRSCGKKSSEDTCGKCVMKKLMAGRGGDRSILERSERLKSQKLEMYRMIWNSRDQY